MGKNHRLTIKLTRMYTQCPHCYSIYRIGPEQIRTAGGRVQCAVCEIIFDSLPALRDELPEEGDQWQSIELPFESEDEEHEPMPEAERDDDGEVPFAPAGSAFAMPPRPARQGSRTMRLAWMIGGGVLAVLLVTQLVRLAPRAMAQNPDLRPAALLICRVSGCTVPPRQDLGDLRLASRDVRAHPSVNGALIISATLVNEADFTQPFPLLEIALSDLEGDAVALRRFQPREYLPDRVDIDAGMAPQSVVQVNLEVVDPGEEAVAFEFAFRSATGGSP